MYIKYLQRDGKVDPSENERQDKQVLGFPV